MFVSDTIKKLSEIALLYYGITNVLIILTSHLDIFRLINKVMARTIPTTDHR